jgi:hypothetical protein
MRIGHKMRLAIDHVTRNPGCSKKRVAEALGASARDWQSGYDPINRAIRAGLLTAVRGPRGVYALSLPTLREAA